MGGTHFGEDGLRANDTPSCTALRRGLELAIEPVFLATAHHRSPGIVGNLSESRC